ncbi:MAG: hypothetical protein K2Q10_08985 [Rhodospirillales bacterium]|nr:hypothetical protein [Rhodospirillales bacterium]
MLTLQDCLDMCDVAPDVVEAIAEHEHLPSILAAELGCSLAGSDEGVERIYDFIMDDIARARTRGDFHRIAQLRLALHHLRQEHPGAGS